jgi:hypothetical protein
MKIKTGEWQVIVTLCRFPLDLVTQSRPRLRSAAQVKAALLRSYLINGFGKGTASAVPLRTNKDAGFSP